MDAVAALERRARRVGVIGRPPWWVADGRLYDLDVDEAMSVIRDCGRPSDEVLSALLDRSGADPEAGLVVLAALARLGLGRCHGDRARIDAFLGELVIAVAEARGGLIPPSRRRLAGVIVDRAWGRVRWSEAKGTRRFVVTDLSAFPERADPSALDAVHAAEVHVAVTQLRAGLADDLVRNRRRRKVARAWDCVLTAPEASERTQSDSNRLGHAQRVLRRSIGADLELLDEPA